MRAWLPNAGDTGAVSDGGVRPLRIGILLPMTGSWDVGKSIAGAVVVALNQTYLETGLRLEYTWADDGCSASDGLAALTKLLEQVFPTVARHLVHVY